jgi:hypothetical protein
MKTGVRAIGLPGNRVSDRAPPKLMKARNGSSCCAVCRASQ